MKTFTEEGKWLRNMLEFHLCHSHLNQVKRTSMCLSKVRIKHVKNLADFLMTEFLLIYY